MTITLGWHGVGYRLPHFAFMCSKHSWLVYAGPFSLEIRWGRGAAKR